MASEKFLRVRNLIDRLNADEPASVEFDKEISLVLGGNGTQFSPPYSHPAPVIREAVTKRLTTLLLELAE